MGKYVNLLSSSCAPSLIFALCSASVIADECTNWTSNQTPYVFYSDSASVVGAICNAFTQQLQQLNGYCVYQTKSCSVTGRTYYNNELSRPIDNVLFTASKTCGGAPDFDVEWHSQAQGMPCTFKAGVPVEEPPPKVCAGNPINIENGRKIQKEVDITPLSHGAIEFNRTYSSKIGLWANNYQRTLTYIDASAISDEIKTSADYGTNKSTVCSSAWAELQDTYPNFRIQNSISTPDVSEDNCEIKKNGVIVKRIPLISNQHYRRITLVPSLIRLNRPDGSILVMKQSGQKWLDLSASKTYVERIDGASIIWRFTSENGEVENYNADGKMLSITANNGMKQELFYDVTSGLLSRVKDSTGRELLFTYVGNQLSSVTVGGNKTTSYTYNAQGLISQVTRSDNTTRVYQYEDSRFPKYLTGITDERGKRYASWAYDAQGRAISSEHAGGAEKTLLAFNADGTTTVTNSLNKQTIYHFTDIVGVRRVTKVEGQPTVNCVGANQEYTYTAEGWVASKTDWKGIRTIFSYNAQGQEISRTEAVGTPEARTITTEWHPTLYVKTKITDPVKETVYDYDVNGRLVSQSSRSLIAQ